VLFVSCLQGDPEMTEPTIVCPQCGKNFPLTRALTDQVETALRREFEQERRVQEKRLREDFDKKLAFEIARAATAASEVTAKEAMLTVGELRQRLSTAEIEKKTLAEEFRKRFDREKEH
jgi:uncharacterized Zn finger protein (UPF0148 family)